MASFFIHTCRKCRKDAVRTDVLLLVAVCRKGVRHFLSTQILLIKIAPAPSFKVVDFPVVRRNNRPPELGSIIR
jgi:hypothetical protein